ncbi:MAG TPA: hypothetical protein DCE14_04750, partial [Kosmotogaceae bacterium]|nr:hypothetical protein [Kosmotogaceae bacterium]
REKTLSEMPEKITIKDVQKGEECGYDLDGKGQLPHLDLLLSLEGLHDIQWVSGEGQPEASEWPDVLSRIREAGKFVQITLSPKGALDLKNKMELNGFILDLAIPEGMTIDEVQSFCDEIIS